MRRDIKEALTRFKINTFGNKKNIENFESILKNDENVLYISPTNMEIMNINTRHKERLPGVCALTNKRFIFQSTILLNINIESISIDKIDSINVFGNGMAGSHIQINTITKTFDILCSYKKEIMKNIVEIFENTINNYKNMNKYDENSISSKNKIQEVSNIEEIKKYKELLDCGAITEEEFNAKKKDLLNL